MQKPHRLGTTLLVLLLLLVGLSAAAGLRWYHTTRPEYRLRRGQAAVLAGQLNEALRQADRLQAAGYPDEAHLLRGQVALYRVAQARGKPSLQRRYLNDATVEYNEIRRDNEAVFAEASLIYGLNFLSLEMQDRAEKLLLDVTQLRPDNVDARRGLAAIYYDRGVMTRALGQMEKWSQLDDGDGQPHRFMGIIYKDFESADDSAIQHYEAALQRRLKPSVREEVVHELAEVLVKRAQYAEALRRLDETEFQTEKSRAALPELRAACLYGLGRTDEAVAILDFLLQEQPPSTRVLRLRAQIHADAGEPKAAVPLLRRALEINPHEAACRYQLAMAYQLLGRGSEAAEQRRLLEETQALYQTFSKLHEEADKNPTSVEVRQRLADLSEKLGKFDLARMWRRAARDCQLAYQPKRDLAPAVP